MYATEYKPPISVYTTAMQEELIIELSRFIPMTTDRVAPKAAETHIG